MVEICLPLSKYLYLELDDVAWIWFFDRENTIQTTGINFVQDLPYFATLLFAFQRFTLRDWGIEPILQNPKDVAAPFDLEFPNPEFPEQNIKISIDPSPSEKIYSNFCLNGHSLRQMFRLTLWVPWSTNYFSATVVSGKELVSDLLFWNVTRSHVLNRA